MRRANSYKHRIRWPRRIWRNFACMKKRGGKNEFDRIFRAASPRDYPGHVRARLAGWNGDAARDCDWSPSRNISDAATMAIQADSGRRKYCGDDSESRAIRISVA